MYKGLHNTGRGKLSTGVEKYGLKNKVHAVQVHGVGAEEFYGPIQPGQTWNAYQAFMEMPIAVGASGAVVGAMVAGPIGAIVGGVGSWLLSGGSKRHTNKPKVQGG